MMRALSPLFVFFPLLVAQAPRPLPPLAEAVAVFDTAAGAALPFEALLDRLAAQDAVFLGETHVDDTTHRVELAVLEGLLQRKPGKVVLSLEMFERDVQPALDDYLAGRCDEATFLHRARPWGNYAVDYRPLVEAARAARIPVLAANFPAALRRQLARGGQQAFQALGAAERALVPAEIFPASDAYWQRVDRAVRGHAMGGASGSPEERLFDAQNLWDNAMGDCVAKALVAHPEATVLHVAGGFHVAYADGTVAQFARRAPGRKAVVVQVATTPALAHARPDRDRDQAQYLVYALAYARSEHEGTFAVEVPAELRYRLAVPPAGTPPLLVWLPDASTRPADAFAYWQRALGDAVAVAVVEPPLPARQPDLAVAGGYVFGDGFRSDYGRMQHGLERIVEYLTRRYPVDAARVVVAGAGEGGAVVLWAGLYSQWLDATLLAVDPTDLGRLGMEALPDLPPAMRALHLAAHGVDEQRLAAVAADYRKVGATATVAAFDGSAAALTAMVRQRLGLPVAAAPAGEPLWLVLEQDLPRARQWAELLALQSQQAGTPARVALASELPADVEPSRVRRLAIGGAGAFPVAAFGKGSGLPLAGGPFGGTTVVWLPAATSEADRTAWRELEVKKVLKLRSPFANIAIAGAGGPDLAALMQDFKQRGRSRVLIVPAVFCADAATMRALQEELGQAGAGMDLQWSPGLGAELRL